MHDTIMGQIISAVWNWFVFPMQWGGITFTVLDFLKYCCLIYVLAFFIWKIALFWIDLFHNMNNS